MEVESRFDRFSEECDKEAQPPLRFFSTSIERNANANSQYQNSELRPKILTKLKQCPLCEQSFDCLTAYSEHVSSHYPDKTFFCDTCASFFRCKSKLSRHLLTHSGIKKHGCSLCTAKFNNPHSLKKHQLIHSGLKPHQCKECNKTFRDSSNLRKHLLKHQGVKFECKQCGKQFKMRSWLAVHIKTHTNDAQWVCSICFKKFYTKKDRNRHQITHSDVREFQCNICNSKFRRKDNLDRHFRNAHSNVEAQPESSVQNCLLHLDESCNKEQQIKEEDRLKILEANNKRESVIFKSSSHRTYREAPETIEEEPSWTRYVHKKVHYDLKKSTASFAKYSDFDDAKARQCIDRFSSNNKTDNNYYSPESIELYKKILCPSYRKDSK